MLGLLYRLPAAPALSHQRITYLVITRNMSILKFVSKKRKDYDAWDETEMGTQLKVRKLEACTDLHEGIQRARHYDTIQDLPLRWDYGSWTQEQTVQQLHKRKLSTLADEGQADMLLRVQVSDRRRDYDVWKGADIVRQAAARGFTWKAGGTNLSKPEVLEKIRLFDRQVDCPSVITQPPPTKQDKKKRRPALPTERDEELFGGCESDEDNVGRPFQPPNDPRKTRKMQAREKLCNGLELERKTAGYEDILQHCKDRCKQQKGPSPDNSGAVVECAFINDKTGPDEDDDRRGKYQDERSFQNARRSNQWLTAGNSGYFCLWCRRHFHICKEENQQREVTPWVGVACKNWRKLSDKVKSNKDSQLHKKAATQEAMRINPSEGLEGVTEMGRITNRAALLKIIASEYWLVKHEMPHTEKLTKLLDLMKRFDKPLDDFSRASKNATYSSSMIASDILMCVNDVLKESILERIKKMKYVSLLVDETEDIRHLEQVAMMVRGVCEEGDVMELFYGMVPIREARNAENLFSFLEERVGTVVRRFEADENGAAEPRGEGICCSGVGFDGASTMQGHIRGLQMRCKYAWEVSCCTFGA